MLWYGGHVGWRGDPVDPGLLVGPHGCTALLCVVWVVQCWAQGLFVREEFGELAAREFLSVAGGESGPGQRSAGDPTAGVGSAGGVLAVGCSRSGSGMGVEGPKEGVHGGSSGG